MFKRSLHAEARAALKWSGPLLAAIGLLAIAATALVPALSESLLGRWTLTQTLTPTRLLPFVGLGIACGLIGARPLAATLSLFALGLGLGLLAEDRLLALLDAVPRAATHLFLTGPISYLAAGAALLVAARWRAFVAPLAALIVGAMAALLIRLTDPTLQQTAFTLVPVMIAVWIVAVLAFTLRSFPRGWFAVFGRIFGSWLVAIGLLSGGTSLLPPRDLPASPPAAAPFPDSTQTSPGPVPAEPGLPGSEPSPPDLFPGRTDRFRQP